MSTKPRLLVPYGLKTLLEGLSRAVVSAQPTNIAHYASFYFTQLLQYRHENPSMDFKDLVQEFHRRQEIAQMQFGPTENLKSGISHTLLPKDKAESEMVENEKERCPAGQDPCAGIASMAEAMPTLLNGALKCPLLHRDISNPLVNADSVFSQLYSRKKDSGPAVAMCKDSVKYQPQEQTSSGVGLSSEQSAEKPERLDKASSKTQSQPTKILGKKASGSGTIPKTSNNQAVHQTTRGQDLDRQYSLPRGISSTGRRTNGATQSVSTLIPERTISKPHNVVNLPGDVQSNISDKIQHPKDQAHSSAPSAIDLAKKTVEMQPPVAVPPTQAAQLKIMSESTNNQQTTERLSSNLYQIHISVDKPVSGICYEPAYIPGKDASMVHIVTAIPTSRTTSVHYNTAPKLSPCENVQTSSVHCRCPSRDLVQYKSVYVPSQIGSGQQRVCQRLLPLHLQQPTYRKTESSKYYTPYVQKKSSSPESVNKQGYSDASSQSSASELNQACSERHGGPDENEEANLRTFYQHGDLRQMEPSVNSWYREEQLPNQSSKLMEFLLCPCMSGPPSSSLQPVLISSPVCVVSDEAKRVASSPPYILVGSSEWKLGHAVQLSNEQNFQRFTKIPTPFACTKTNTGNQMQDLSFHSDPMYVSVAVPVEEVQRMSATPSITHLAETRSIPSFAAHGNAVAIAVATTRCPSVMDGLDQKPCSTATVAQDDEGYIRLSKTEDKMPY